MAKENNRGQNLIVGIAALALTFGAGYHEGHNSGYKNGQSDLVKSATTAQKLASFVNPKP